jgi:hypothetical protein
MTLSRKQPDAVTRRYGRQLTNQEISAAVRDRTPPRGLRTARPTQSAPHGTASTIIADGTAIDKLLG